MSTAGLDLLRTNPRTYARTADRTIADPTLFLDFQSATALDPRITFSRGSQATLFDSTGTLKYAKHNLLLQSQDFATTWSATNTTIVVNDTTAPDGTVTADKATQTSTSNPRVTQQVTVLGQYQFSVFIKYIDIQWIRILIGSNSVWFDVQNGLVGTADPDRVGSIEVSANGFYRLIVNASNLSGATTFFIIGADANNSVNELLGSYYAWGAQLNLANMEGGVTSSLTTYYPTTTAAYYAPCFTYDPATLQPQGLLIWEARTNLLLQSEDFSTTWVAARASVTTNTTVAPNGTLTGDKLIATSVSGSHLISQTISVTAQAYTLTCFAKAGEYNFIQLNIPDPGAGGAGKVGSFNLSTGTLGVVQDAGVTRTITSVGNGWYRCSITYTITGAGSSGISFFVTNTDVRAESFTGNDVNGIFIWGAQLEAGAFATSYIPTTTTALTRSADVASMTGTNFSSWYNASEGTTYVEAQSPSVAGTYFYYSLNNGTTNEIRLASASSGSNPTFVVTNTSSSQASIAVTLAAGTAFKAASAYATDSFSSAVNGTLGTPDTSGTPPTATSLRIGARSNDTLYVNGYIRRIAYYPTRLPNATLQGLTA